MDAPLPRTLAERFNPPPPLWHETPEERAALVQRHGAARRLWREQEHARREARRCRRLYAQAAAQPALDGLEQAA